MYVRPSRYKVYVQLKGPTQEFLTNNIDLNKNNILLYLRAVL